MFAPRRYCSEAAPLASCRLRSGVWVVSGLALLACQRSEDAAERSAPAPVSASATVARSARPGAGTEAAEPSTRVCAATCAIARELGCARAGDCPATCAEMWNVPTCREPVRAALQCFAGEPASRWECDEEGQAAIRDGHCDREQRAAASCLERVGQ